LPESIITTHKELNIDHLMDIARKAHSLKGRGCLLIAMHHSSPWGTSPQSPLLSIPVKWISLSDLYYFPHLLSAVKNYNPITSAVVVILSDKETNDFVVLHQEPTPLHDPFSKWKAFMIGFGILIEYFYLWYFSRYS
jgi:hypothetical protein